MPGLNNAPVSIDLAGAEIVAWVPGAEVAAVCGGDDTIRFVAYDAAFKNPEVVLEAVFEGSIQSVTAHGSYVAVAESLSKTETGLVRVYRYTAENTLEAVFSQEVGYLPDSVAWSADGQTIVVANEGEPNDYYGTRKGIDPQGSISILRVDPDQGAALISAETLDFAGFSVDQLEAAGVRLSGMNAANPSRDLEPEFVRITPDSQQAVVTLQENNAMVVVDLASGTLGQPIGLGAKDWSGLSVDTSDDDGGYFPGERDFQSLYMPDGMDVWSGQDGTTYVALANEGDGRVRPDDVNFEAESDGDFVLVGAGRAAKLDSRGFDAIAQLEDPLTGDQIAIFDGGVVAKAKDRKRFEAEAGDEFFVTKAFGAVADDDFYSDEIRAGKLESPAENLIVSGGTEGRLKTIADRNTSDSITGFGGRSFTIRTLDGAIVWDSGDLLDQIAVEYGVYDDGRSDDKSIEPEHVEVATLGERSFAFVSLERGTSTLIPVFEVTDVTSPEHVYTFHAPESISPEATEFIATGTNDGVLLVSSEVSGTLDAFPFGTDLL